MLKEPASMSFHCLMKYGQHRYSVWVLSMGYSILPADLHLHTVITGVFDRHHEEGVFTGWA